MDSRVKSIENNTFDYTLKEIIIIVGTRLEMGIR